MIKPPTFFYFSDYWLVMVRLGRLGQWGALLSLHRRSETNAWLSSSFAHPSIIPAQFKKLAIRASKSSSAVGSAAFQSALEPRLAASNNCLAASVGRSSL